MKKLLFVLFYYFFFFSCFSQNRKTIHGKIIVNNGVLLENIDVLNNNTKDFSIADKEGDFSIVASENDVILFFSKKYNDIKIVLKPIDFEKKELLVSLSEKPIELEEVEVLTKPKIQFSQAALDEIKLEKQISRPVNQSVYTGEIVNGMDFIRIGKEIIKLFKKKKDPKEEKEPQILFKEYVVSNFDEAFFIETLGLKKETIFLFIAFCESDIRSKTVFVNKNKMEVMDFLISKTVEFKKL